MEIICFLLAVQSALLFNMIILSKGVIFLKYNSTANGCEEDHHSSYGRNFGSCEKKHKITFVVNSVMPITNSSHKSQLAGELH